MRRRATAALVVAAAGLLVWLAVPAVTSTGLREDLPWAYVGRVNPRAADPGAIAAGAVLFQDNCASCHGAQGDGHGAAAVALTPPPADLRASDVVTRHSDAYLYYRLSEGKPGTAMPSFHGALGEQDRWALVAYLRSLHDARR